MTHCNAGALATCGWGTATAPIFLAHCARPAGARLGQRDAAAPAGRQPHGLGARAARRSAHDHRRRRERGADAPARRRCRVRRRGPRRAQRRRVQQDRNLRQGAGGEATTTCRSTSRCPRRRSTRRFADGDAIPIESRSPDEVLEVLGRDEYGQAIRVGVAPENARALNPAFDVTPARLVTGLLTERGVATPSEAGSPRSSPSDSRERRSDAERRRCASSVIATALGMNTAGINRSRSGNVSARWRCGWIRRLPGHADRRRLRPPRAPTTSSPSRTTAMRVRSTGAVVRVALPPRHLSGARRTRRPSSTRTRRSAPRWPASAAAFRRSTTWSRWREAATSDARRTPRSDRRSSPTRSTSALDGDARA